MKLRTLKDLDITNKKVFLRLDLNLPIKDGKITDDTRLREALPTVRAILEKTPYLCIASHLGRPDGKPNSKYSLAPVGEALAEKLGTDVLLYHDFAEEPSSKAFGRIEKNQILLLENLRFYPGEEDNDPDYARRLIEGYDCYVNDAFGTCHRAHASVVGVTEFIPRAQCAAGFLIEKEIAAFAKILQAPQHPFTVIIGGSKVSDKISVVLHLMERCNNVLIGGAMAYTFLKAKGVDVGASRVEEDKLSLVETIERAAAQRKVTIHLPQDHICASTFDESAKPEVVDSEMIPKGLMGLDIGPKTQARYRDIILNSKTVLWNGPMGVFEWKNFAEGSMSVAHAMADAPHCLTVVGGGDSVSAAEKAGVTKKLSHVSTGGGASLELLEGKTLPGIKVLSL